MADGYEEMEDDEDTGNESEGIIAHREDLRFIRVANKAARNTTKSGDRKVVDRKVVDHKVVDRNGVERIVRPPPAPKALWTSPELHGVWSDRRIVMVAEWRTLRDTAQNGDDDALGYIVYLNSLYQRPDRRQTPSITDLIREWSGFQGRNKSQVAAYRAKVKLMVPAPAPSEPEPSSSFPELYEGIGDDYPDDFEHYRLTSPMSPDIQITSPSDPPQAAGQDWASVPVGSWP